MKIVFTEQAWDEYVYWQKNDRKIVKKLNELLEDIKRNGYTGIGKPEALKNNLTGFYSRRINQEHRIVYRLDNACTLCEIIQCRGHY